MPKFKLSLKRKKQWCEALDSGSYVQGRGELKRSRATHTEFCCLGVAKEIGLCTDSKSEDELHFFVSKKFLPKKVQENLAAKNDGGWDFRRISKWIKRYL